MCPCGALQWHNKQLCAHMHSSLCAAASSSICACKPCMMCKSTAPIKVPVRSASETEVARPWHTKREATHRRQVSQIGSPANKACAKRAQECTYCTVLGVRLKQQQLLWVVLVHLNVVHEPLDGICHVLSLQPCIARTHAAKMRESRDNRTCSLAPTNILIMC